MSVIYSIKKKRFRGNAPPKYGSLNKGFSEQEVQAFFKVIENDKFHLLFGYQAQLGLRIGEAVKVNVKDIKFETRELIVKTEKAHVIDTMLIPIPLSRQTVEFINRNEKAITQAGGYVFFAELGHSLRGEPFLRRTTCGRCSGSMSKRQSWTESTTRARNHTEGHLGSSIG